MREVVLRDKPAELLAVSPKATVPVLVFAGGEIIDESLDIMHWAHGDPLPAAAAGLIDRNDREFKPLLDRYKYPERFPGLPQSGYREQGASFLAELESRLAEAPALSGAEFGFLDWAIAPFIRQFAGVDADWFGQSSFPQVRAWQRAFADSSLFERVMQKYPQWRPGDAEIDFPPSANA